MKTAKLTGLIAFVLLLASSAAATKITPNRGPTGSPPCGSSLTLAVTSAGNNFPFADDEDNCTAEDGTVTALSITFPTVDALAGVTCGISNAFLDGGVDGETGYYISSLGGFSPVINNPGANETATCYYTTFTGVSKQPPGIETIPRMEQDCSVTNFEYTATSPKLVDAEDCAGVPDPGSFSDVDFTITGAVGGVSLAGTTTVTPTPTPEPASLAFLVLGLGSLGLFVRRRLT